MFANKPDINPPYPIVNEPVPSSAKVRRGEDGIPKTSDANLIRKNLVNAMNLLDGDLNLDKVTQAIEILVDTRCLDPHGALPAFRLADAWGKLIEEHSNLLTKSDWQSVLGLYLSIITLDDAPHNQKIIFAQALLDFSQRLGITSIQFHEPGSLRTQDIVKYPKVELSAEYLIDKLEKAGIKNPKLDLLNYHIYQLRFGKQEEREKNLGKLVEIYQDETSNLKARCTAGYYAARYMLLYKKGQALEQGARILSDIAQKNFIANGNPLNSLKVECLNLLEACDQEQPDVHLELKDKVKFGLLSWAKDSAPHVYTQIKESILRGERVVASYYYQDYQYRLKEIKIYSDDQRPFMFVYDGQTNALSVGYLSFPVDLVTPEPESVEISAVNWVVAQNKIGDMAKKQEDLLLALSDLRTAKKPFSGDDLAQNMLRVFTKLSGQDPHSVHSTPAYELSKILGGQYVAASSPPLSSLHKAALDNKTTTFLLARKPIDGDSPSVALLLVDPSGLAIYRPDADLRADEPIIRANTITKLPQIANRAFDLLEKGYAG